MATIAERVQAGVEFLNEKMPGWEKKINLDTLDLADGRHCILGQIFAAYAKTGRSGYNYGCEYFGFFADTEYLYNCRFDYGFSINNTGSFQELTAEWWNAISALRKPNPDTEHLVRAIEILGYVTNEESREGIITYTLFKMNRPESDRPLVKFALGL